MCSDFFFFNDTATTEIYTLSLHDALPISRRPELGGGGGAGHWQRSAHGLLRHRPDHAPGGPYGTARASDRKSTRLNSSHLVISYAVFCLKKKKRKADRWSNRFVRGISAPG